MKNENWSFRAILDEVTKDITGKTPVKIQVALSHVDDSLLACSKDFLTLLKITKNWDCGTYYITSLCPEIDYPESWPWYNKIS
jgi:hypothetical protein